MAHRKSKKRTRALAKKKKLERTRQDLLEQNPELVLIQKQAELVDEIVAGLKSATSPQDYLDLRFESVLTRVRAKARHFDPARVIATMRLCLFFSASQPPLALVETAALILYSGYEPLPASEYPKASVDARELGQLVEELLDDLREITTLTVLSCQVLESNDLAAAGLHARHTLALQWIRETTYSSIQFELYDHLFEDSWVNELITSKRGYSYSQLKIVMQWMLGMANERRSGAQRDFINARRSGDKSKAASALTKLTAPPFEMATFSALEISADSGMPEDQIEGILRDFSIDLKRLSLVEVSRMLQEGSSPLFSTPLIRERDGRYILANESLLAPAIQRSLETDLIKNSAYGNRRGELAEELLISTLKMYLPDSSIFSGLRYSTESGIRGEVDAVLIQGDVALIFEVKAGTIYKLGERTPMARFRRQMRQNISYASRQLSQIVEIIKERGEIPLERGEPLNFAEIKEVHSIVVTLDELLDFATQPFDLVAAGILASGDQIPWITSIGDLRLILTLADEPSEFLVYLRRRRDPLIARKYKTTDEMDLFFAFRETGLWAEDDTDASKPVLVSSMTGPLDNWIHGLAERKPAIKATPLLKYARQVRLRQLPHWFEFGAAVLSLSEKTQFSIEQRIQEILAMTGTDHFAHRTTDVVHDAEPTRYGGVIVFQTTGLLPGPFSSKELIEYLQIKKTQCGVARAFACILDPRGEVTNLIYEGNQIPKSNFSEEEYARLDPC